jgi:hypothetical protein
MTGATLPLLVEIVAYAPTAFFHCAHCEVAWQATGFDRGLRAEQARAGLPADLAADYQAVSDWVRSLLGRWGSRVAVKVIDAASIEGFWKTVRHGLRRYPAVLVAGRRCSAGPGFEAAEAAVAQQLAPLTPAAALPPVGKEVR